MTAAKTRRVLSLSTLWPNAAKPRFGAFVARSLETLQKDSHWDVTVINPVGVPPIALGRYAALRAAAVDGIEQGVRVYRPLFRLLPKLGGRLNPDAIVRAVLPLAKALHRESRFDLVDAQFFYPDGPAAARIAHALGLPLSIKARGSDIHYWGSRSYGRTALLDAASAARGVLAVSEALAEDMRALGIPGDKITVHYTGLDRDRFRPLDHESLRRRMAEELDIPIGWGEPLLLGVGALTPRKGHDLTIRALTALAEARLVLVGEGEAEAALRKLAQEIGVADRVHFIGSVDHDLLPPLLSAADVMVLPSASEGLANAWIEALACGTPIVITDAGGAREVVRSRAAGRIITRSVRGVVDGVSSVLSERRDRLEVAETAARFSWHVNAAELSTYYDRLVTTR